MIITISVTFNGPASNVILLIAGKLMCQLHTLVTIVIPWLFILQYELTVPTNGEKGEGSVNTTQFQITTVSQLCG